MICSFQLFEAASALDISIRHQGVRGYCRVGAWLRGRAQPYGVGARGHAAWRPGPCHPPPRPCSS